MLFFVLFLSLDHCLGHWIIGHRIARPILKFGKIAVLYLVCRVLNGNNSTRRCSVHQRFIKTILVFLTFFN